MDANDVDFLGVFPYLALPHDADDEEMFAAAFDGGQEVPPVASNAQGAAHFFLNEQETELRKEIVVDNTQNIVAAHIHCAPEGQNGPVAVTLYDGPPVTPQGLLVQGTLTATNPNNSCSLDTIAELRERPYSGKPGRSNPWADQS